MGILIDARTRELTGELTVCMFASVTTNNYKAQCTIAVRKFSSRSLDPSRSLPRMTGKCIRGPGYVLHQIALRAVGFDDCKSESAEMLMSVSAPLSLLALSHAQFEPSWGH